MELLAPASMRRMPWKNGGGVTTEIAIAPAGATLETFDWRVSAAQVDAPGRFSRFDGVDRTLAVTAGGNLTLRRVGGEGGEGVWLAPGGPPASFPGEAEIHATLDAPLCDFNVMTRRNAWAHHVEVLTLEAGAQRKLPLVRQRMQWLIYGVQGALSVSAQGAGEVHASPGAAIWMDAPSGTETLSASVAWAGYLVALWPIAETCGARAEITR